MILAAFIIGLISLYRFDYKNQIANKLPRLGIITIGIATYAVGFLFESSHWTGAYISSMTGLFLIAVGIIVRALVKPSEQKPDADILDN